MLHLTMLKDEDIDLGEALYQIKRALTSEWPEDLPRAVRDLLPIVEFYRSTARHLIKDIEEARNAEESEAEQVKLPTNKP